MILRHFLLFLQLLPFAYFTFMVWLVNWSYKQGHFAQWSQSALLMRCGILFAMLAVIAYFYRRILHQVKRDIANYEHRRW